MKNNDKEKDIRLFEKEVKELSDEQLDSVAGGFGFLCPINCQYSTILNRCLCNGEKQEDEIAKYRNSN